MVGGMFHSQVHRVLIRLADECQTKFGSPTVWKACCAVFDLLNLAAVRMPLCAYL